MAQSIDNDAQLRVSAHVLVQLGAELVTDVEQAILECVKNAYDADSQGCRIDIDTRADVELIEESEFRRLGPHRSNAAGVVVSLTQLAGEEIPPGVLIQNDTRVRRKLACSGRVTISDNGAGIPFEQIKSAWLMISGSLKRSAAGIAKAKTTGGRTPLGDKGLGRLGTMKIGDVLLVESATHPDLPISAAHFRWKDCETAVAVDEVPVNAYQRHNKERLKGTRVTVLGLNDLVDWRRKGRIDQIAQSLARLVSPFEATTTFPVTLTLDGQEHSLMAVTNQVLSQAVAEFTFAWTSSADGDHALKMKAKFKKGLFGENRSADAKAKYDLVFGHDGGKEFFEFLGRFSRTKTFSKNLSVGPWFLEISRDQAWVDVLLDDAQSAIDPGSFHGALHFFHLDSIQESAAAGLGASKRLIKDMAGVSILRDGFQVRSPGDWLGIAAGMTGGSTYHMRVNNTIGYFALSGEANYQLVEKSDREGFVENQAYRGFYSISIACKKFANSSLESLRRAFDAFAKEKETPKLNGTAMSPQASIEEVASTLGAIKSFKETADGAVTLLNKTFLDFEKSSNGLPLGSSAALNSVKDAVTKISRLHDSVKSEIALDAFELLQKERSEHREQMMSMVESAAVGLSARGLAHELRTHLGEIRYRLTQISKGASTDQSRSGADLARHIQSIRTSCSAIMSAASLIDPMLPRSRALKDSFKVADFLRDYVSNRAHVFEREAILVSIDESADSGSVKINRARLLQVLDNLVRNSVYWLRRMELFGGGDIEKSIFLAVTNEGFSISDNGPGVDPHYEHSLFEIFISGKPDRDPGQGLGLFICTQLLAADGCSIKLSSVRNEKGRLNRFEVDLSNVKGA